MLGSKLVAILSCAISLYGALLMFGVTHASAETQVFPQGHRYYAECSKIKGATAKEDARPSLEHFDLRFSDTGQWERDLILGPVKSTADEVVISEAKEADPSDADPHEIFGVSLSRTTGVLTITNKSKTKEAKYICKPSASGTTF